MGERGPKTKKANRGGRPPVGKKINWEEFKKLVSYQCTQEEVAAFFDVDLDTLAKYYQEKFGGGFSEFWGQKKPAGRAKLKKIQWALAEQGSTAMAIFLGKHLLGQSDKPVDEQILEAVQKAGMTKDQAIELIRNASQTAQATGKKTFEEFVAAADYPLPYAKQIEMMQFGMNEIMPRLLLGSRGYGKTDYVVILGIAYDLYVNPHTSTNLIMTKSKERNAAMLAEIAVCCEKNGVVFEKRNATHLRVAGLKGKDHSVSAVTIKTVTLRGRHPKRTVMDDPVTEDDVSDATRLLVEKKYNEVMKLGSNVLVIGQPAHKYDLYAKLRGLLKTMEVPHGTIPELDHDLEAQRLAGVDEKSIQASYFLKIINEGATPFDLVRYIDKFPTGDSAVAFIDPSSVGHDHTAISIIKSHMQGIAVVGFQWRKAWNHCLDDMTPHLKSFNVRKLCFETNALGSQPLDILRQTFKQAGLDIGVVGRVSTQNKHSRIMAAGSYAHLIHLSKQSHKSYLDHVVQYEYKAKFDDAPDSLATCLEWIGLIRGKQ